MNYHSDSYGLHSVMMIIMSYHYDSNKLHYVVMIIISYHYDNYGLSLCGHDSYELS